MRSTGSLSTSLARSAASFEYGALSMMNVYQPLMQPLMPVLQSLQNAVTRMNYWALGPPVLPFGLIAASGPVKHTFWFSLVSTRAASVLMCSCAHIMDDEIMDELHNNCLTGAYCEVAVSKIFDRSL